MRQNNLDGLTQFMVVSETRSFSAAAVRLGISPSAASQAIRGLEQRLGTRLFSRSTRSVALTEAGARFLEMVAPALRDLKAAEDEIGNASSRPKGKLRLNVQRAAYMMIVHPLLDSFFEAYPEIDVEIVIDTGMADIVGEGFDAGIRFGDVVEKDMIGISVGPPLAAYVLAAPAYLTRFGEPRHPRELLAHNCIGFRHMPSGIIERWEFEKDGEKLNLAVTGRLVLNDSASLVQAALDGLGVTYMINGFVEPFIEDGRLVRILANWSPPLTGFQLYYPDRRRVPAKLRAFIDFVRAPRPRLSAPVVFPR